MMKSVWALTVLFGCGLVNVASTFLTEDVKTEILNIQNTLRRQFSNGASGGPVVANMAKLSWSSALETIAQETLELQCSLAARPSVGTFRRISWNSNVKLNSRGNFTSDINSWYQEITTTPFFAELQACFPYSRCTQAYKLLDAAHSNTGCAYQRHCHGNMNVFLCLYDKQRTTSSRGFFSAGPVCTRCDNARPFCDDGLCVACNSGQTNTCDCRKTCQKPGAGNGTLNATTCVCNCSSGLGPNCDQACRNPENFYDYDMCEAVTEAECNDPQLRQIMAYHCPEQCVCRRYPGLG